MYPMICIACDKYCDQNEKHWLKCSAKIPYQMLNAGKKNSWYIRTRGRRAKRSKSKWKGKVLNLLKNA